MKLVLIDNYDSFTYNLKVLLNQAGAEVDVVRNDQFDQLEGYDAVVISPGPGLPKDSGKLMDFLSKVDEELPIFGVCLGLQAIGEYFGATLSLMERPLHGVYRSVFQNQDAIFHGIPQGFNAARYHSWYVSKIALPDCLEVIATDEEDKIMALKHKERPVYGVQFHPESVLTDTGLQLIKNFLQIVNTTKNETIRTTV